MRETSPGDLGTSWETARISLESAGVIMKYFESQSFNAGWMFHCSAETKMLEDKCIGQICYTINLLTEFASWCLNGELLPFPVVSQIQRRGLWGVQLKGAPARESRTGTRLVSPAGGREKKKVTPPELGSNLDFTIIECARVYQNVAYII